MTEIQRYSVAKMLAQRPCQTHILPTPPAVAVKSSAVNADSKTSSSIVDSSQPEENIDHFTRWRPKSHFIAMKNWMNDPCGPCYDSTTGLFHLLYQYNPFGATWGNMAWHHATSHDLVHWKHVNDEATLIPSSNFDAKGVFSGAMLPIGPQGQSDTLTAIYTAVSHLPIHYTKVYKVGSEKLAMAISTNGGKSWQANKLILNGPPQKHTESIKSWRDPFITSLPVLDKHFGHEEGKYLYGLISGSLLDKTPTAFLYRIDKEDLSNWTFISDIIDVGMDKKVGQYSMGRNWEVCNFLSFETSSKSSNQYLLMNVEGVGANYASRYPMWIKVDINAKESDKLYLTFPKKGGLVDHGCLYAATTFWHQETQRRIMWGWITEDDLAERRYDQQGWSGCISLPRQILQLEYENVDPSIMQNELIASTFDVVQQSESSFCLSTIGFKLINETQGLRSGAKHVIMRCPTFNHSLVKVKSERSAEFLLDIDIDPEKGLGENDEVGLLLCHDECMRVGVKVVYCNETLYVVRKDTTDDPDITTSTLSAPMPLLRFIDSKGNTQIEQLQLHVIIDNSVLEVFCNNRTVITTRIYFKDDSSETPYASLYSRQCQCSNGGAHCCRHQIAGKHGDYIPQGLERDIIEPPMSTTRAKVAKFEAFLGLRSAMMDGENCRL